MHYAVYARPIVIHSTTYNSSENLPSNTIITVYSRGRLK